MLVAPVRRVGRNSASGFSEFVGYPFSMIGSRACALRHEQSVTRDQRLIETIEHRDPMRGRDRMRSLESRIARSVTSTAEPAPDATFLAKFERPLECSKRIIGFGATEIKATEPKPGTWPSGST